MKGYYHPTQGYWETISAPDQRYIDAYPAGTVEVPIKPGPDYDWINGAWEPTAPAPENPSDFPLQRWQFHAMVDILEDQGKVTRAQIDAAIDSIQDVVVRSVVRAKYTQSDVFRYDAPEVGMLTAMVNLNPTDLTAAWLVAKGL